MTIDLSKICKMINGTGGTATCSSTYQHVSAAFGGATSLTVAQMLAYAASQSNSGGSTWYANVKATRWPWQSGQLLSLASRQLCCG